jgi:hypothetical protein
VTAVPDQRPVAHDGRLLREPLRLDLDIPERDARPQADVALAVEFVQDAEDPGAAGEGAVARRVLERDRADPCVDAVVHVLG